MYNEVGGKRTGYLCELQSSAAFQPNGHKQAQTKTNKQTLSTFHIQRYIWNLKIHDTPLDSMKMQRHLYITRQGKAFVKVMQGLLSVPRALYGDTT